MNNPLKVQLPLFKDVTQLPTGKNHISYSELFLWNECSWRHKLLYVDKLPGDPPNEYLEFGQVFHDAIEEFMLHHHESSYKHSQVIADAHEALSERFDNIGFFDKGEQWEAALEHILNEMPDWLDKTFPGWKPVSAEFKLFEQIGNQTNKWFKGFLDTVIKAPKPPRKGSKPKPNEPVQWQYWILDWKTTLWGWTLDKKTDFNKQLQLILYKHYFCELFEIDLKDVKCAFVLCKRNVKPGQSHIEKFDVSVGPIAIEKGLQLVEKMLNSVSKGMTMKNRNSCKYCKFKNTKECP